MIINPRPEPEPCVECSQPAEYTGMDERTVAFKCSEGHHQGRDRRPDDGVPKCDQCAALAAHCKPCQVTYCEACGGHVCQESR
jgi:hypothetical protein